MRGFAIIPVLMLLAGCGEERGGPSDPRDAPEQAAPVPDNALRSVGALLGEYRVAGIDDEPLDAEFGIALSIDGPVLSYEPACAGFVWTISFDRDGHMMLTRNPDFGPELQLDGTYVVCDVEVPPELRQLGEALDRVNLAQRTLDGGLLLSGNGRSVTLFSQ
jgi:hypothetical protein